MITQERIVPDVQLNPCALSFCGNKAELYRFKEYDNTHYKVMCEGCGLSTVLYLTPQEAIKGWNY